MRLWIYYYLATTTLIFPTSCYSYSSSSFVGKSINVPFLTRTHDSSSPPKNDNILTMKISRNKSKTSHYKGSTLALKNFERQKIAGRRGTKRFLDPCKVFVGNLPYTATEDELKQFLVEENGIPEGHILSLKIIRDWKTGDSKGYGFVQFTDPIYATSAMELVKGRKLGGRVVRFDQGKKKEVDPVILVKETQGEDEEEEIEGKEYSIDELAELEEEDEVDDDDDDFEVDGIYNEEYFPEDDDDSNEPMNRKKRREAARKNKKKKKPAVCFG